MQEYTKSDKGWDTRQAADRETPKWTDGKAEVKGKEKYWKGEEKIYI